MSFSNKYSVQNFHIRISSVELSLIIYCYLKANISQLSCLCELLSSLLMNNFQSIVYSARSQVKMFLNFKKVFWFIIILLVAFKIAVMLLSNRNLKKDTLNLLASPHTRIEKEKRKSFLNFVHEDTV